LKRVRKRFVRLIPIIFLLVLLLIVVEIVAGWRCTLEGRIPSPEPPSKERQAAVSKLNGYSRPEDDAYLSIPEWYIVWSYQEKADFQEKNLPSGFPYFGAVRQYWGNYCCISRLIRGKYEFNAGEQVMLAVIGTSFSAEYILKGLYENTIGRVSEWISGHKPTEEDAYAARVARDYAEFVHVRPFYEYRFAPRVSGLWEETRFWGEHPLRKWERKAFLTLDYSVEAFYCFLIELATHIGYGYEPDRTFVWLDNVDGSAIAAIPQVKIAKQVGARAYIVDAPRYQPFTDAAMAFVRSGAHFVEIAGNSSITISMLVPESWTGAGLPATRLFSMPVLTHPGMQRVTLRCDVDSLARVLTHPPEKASVEHVYDY